MEAHVLEGGFADLPVDASHAFRAVMTAMARPGDIAQVSGALPPAPMTVAATSRPEAMAVGNASSRCRMTRAPASVSPSRPLLTWGTVMDTAGGGGSPL